MATVYIARDRAGRVIYVGITGSGPRRNEQHHRTSEWWPYLDRQDVEHFDTRQDAAAREKALIRQHLPPFNKQHNPDWRARRAGYLALMRADSGSSESDPVLALAKAAGYRVPFKILCGPADDRNGVYTVRVEEDFSVIAKAWIVPTAVPIVSESGAQIGSFTRVQETSKRLFDADLEAPLVDLSSTPARPMTGIRGHIEPEPLTTRTLLVLRCAEATFTWPVPWLEAAA